MNVSLEIITRAFQIIRTVSYTMVYICTYIIIVSLMRNCIVGDEMDKEMHEEETLSTNGVLSHSKFCYEGYEYYWHYDYQSKKSGIVQYYRCKHYNSSYKCKCKLNMADGFVKLSKNPHTCIQEIKNVVVVTEDASDRMADMVETIALGSPEFTPSQISLEVKRYFQKEFEGNFLYLFSKNKLEYVSVGGSFPQPLPKKWNMSLWGDPPPTPLSVVVYVNFICVI